MIRLILAALLLASTAAAQQTPRVWRVGFLGDGSRAERLAINVEPFREGLRELGYVEGRNLVIEERWTEGRGERLRDLAAELVRLKVDVIVTHGVRATQAVQAATTTIPIVFATAPDVISTKIVASLARPGGNTTGMTDQVTELAEKELQILKEAVPRLKRIAILWTENNPGARATFDQTSKAAEKLGLAVDVVGVKGPDELEAAVARAAKGRPDALVVVHDIVTVNNRARIAHAAIKFKLPSICGSTPYVDAGGLITYAASTPALFKRSAAFVDRILKGAKPADIPIEQPTSFQLRINLKTARALGLTISPALLARADDIIQ
jgi:putative ABC transport system substrate-binding protein